MSKGINLAISFGVVPLGERTSISDHCPYCHVPIYSTSAMMQNPHDLPAPGAITICDECGAIATFDDFVKLRKMTDGELGELKASAQWKGIDELCRLIRQSHGTFILETPHTKSQSTH
jgi:hypothetical protein